MKTIGLTLMIMIFLVSCYRPSQKVIQGQCVENDKGTTPEKERIRIETQFATMGQEPVPGDWLRISYTEKGNTNKALRIMNLTAQKRLLLDVGIKLTDKGPQKMR
jgi:hypothetical protein